ncbi:MAG: branched-chain amino acid ABC transporter permease [Gammaproteobacteria bacterium]|nr:branched-chain amino acid ABC transporter permease [Gammaproteobacteria bacterium]
MNFSEGLQLLPITLTDGLVLGLLYAVIALGYTMVYGVLGLINFAHAEIFMVGGIVGIEVLTFGTAGTGMHPALQLLLAVTAAMLISGALAVVTERIAYRPLRLRNAPRLVPLITACGVSLFLQDFVRFIESLFGNFIRPFPDFEFFYRSVELSDSVIVPYKSIAIVLVGVAMLIGLTYLVNYTRLGRAVRAVAQDQKASALMGIDVNRMIALTFLVGGALGGVAGVLYGLQFGKLDPFSGFIPGIKAFTAAVLGGIGNIPGAMLGGIVLGVLEVLAGTYLPILTDNAVGTEYKDIFAFGILILILIFRPSGLLGRATVEKV